ncbi:MAG: hypothetical protein L0287_28885, partial [Anaerolineae bacterium]|nr:hypothetical protein [Anaerolineae bacterium]
MTRELRLISAKLAPPILRALAMDRLTLTTVGWLHREHIETSHLPSCFADGSPAILPFFDRLPAPIYYFPSLEQHGLLYQPLLFHEFGHLLYRCHQREMDDLVGELIEEIEDILIPASQRNDRYFEQTRTQRQEIAYTWYDWAQELFCDAVGFTIGGPCFVYSFSRFFGMASLGDFVRRTQDLQRSSHPVTWLRVHFLSRRAETAGFPSLAQQLEDEWEAVAQVMGVTEDYLGFYDTMLDRTIIKTIEDMLIEGSPRSLSNVEAAGGEWIAGSDAY